MLKKTIHSIIGLMLAVAGLQAQIQVTAALDSSTILLGDQLRLHFRITQPAGSEYLSADFTSALDSLEAVELISVEAPSTRTDGDQEIISQSILITSFQDGRHSIPGIRFQSKDGQGSHYALSNPVYLSVSPISVSEGEPLRPIKDIMEEPRRISDWLHWLLIPLGLVLLLGLAFWLWKRKPKDTEAAPPVIPVEKDPAHVIALRQVTRLEKDQLWAKGETKAHYSGISHIAREYLENRYGVNALETVTAEILPEVKAQTDMPQALQEDLAHILHLSDMVKFAKLEPAEPTHASLLQQLRHLVEQTQAYPETQNTEA